MSSLQGIVVYKPAKVWRSDQRYVLGRRWEVATVLRQESRPAPHKPSKSRRSRA